MKKLIYKKLFSVVPKSVSQSASKMLIKSGIKEDVKTWVGRRVFLCLILSVLFLFLSVLFFSSIFPANYNALGPNANLFVLIISFLGSIASFALLVFISYLILLYRVHERAKRIEKVLPDFLLMLVSNLRAGMTPYEAFIKSAQPEFAPLDSEIQIAAAKMLGSESLSDALEELRNRFDSKIFDRTFLFFNRGLKSGGKLAKLLEGCAEDIRKIGDLKAEYRSSTKSYTVFLIFILVFVMPFLLAISYHFILFFSNIQAQQSANTSITLSVFSGKIGITKDFIERMSLIILFVTSLLVSSLIGSISEGKPIYGIKYFPVFFFLGTFVMYISRDVVGAFIKGFI
ncbi:MAG: type II secretion system F family protein [Candidatus Micrarchaeota archaeon]